MSAPKRFPWGDELPNPSVELNAGGCMFVTRVTTLLQRSPAYVRMARAKAEEDALADDRRARVPPSTANPLEGEEVGALGDAVMDALVRAWGGRAHPPPSSRKRRAAASTTEAEDDDGDDDDDDDHDGRDEREDGAGEATTRLSAARPRQRWRRAPEAVSVFVDRDGTHFRYVLNFLRDGMVVLPPSPVVLHELLVEARHYRLHLLASLVSERIVFLRDKEEGGGGRRRRRHGKHGKGGGEAACDHANCRHTSPAHASGVDIEDSLEAAAATAAGDAARGSVGSGGGDRPPVLIGGDLSPPAPARRQARRHPSRATPDDCPMRDSGRCLCSSERDAPVVPHPKSCVLVLEPSSSPAPPPEPKPRPAAGDKEDKAKTKPGRQTFEWDEIRRHNRPDDCWLVVKGRVYDVTRFLKHHPAGVDSIVRLGGTDCTVDFSFHSVAAQRVWKGMEIGRVAGASRGCMLM